MRINTNITAMNTFSQYTNNNNKIASAVEKLSSGYAINSAADNAAGLAISEKMRAQIRGLDQASSNSQDAISLVQTAEGALNSSTEILQRMREIAVQSSSDTNNDSIDREALQDEFSQLKSELDEISSTTTFNKKNLLDGSLSSSTTEVKNALLANSSMAVTAGQVSAGNYGFAVVTKQESAAVDSKQGTTTVAMGTKATASFSAYDATNPTAKTALYNGDYTLSTKVKDGVMTVTATGNNNQTFTASISTADIGALSTGEKLNLNFASSTGATDGFNLSLTLKSDGPTSDNGLDTLSSAINDVTVSVGGGVDAKAATYGVYATMTGADAVKLNAGDKSVTFSNGLTVNFDELTATDVSVNISTKTVTTPNVPGYGNTLTPSAGSDIANIFTGTDGTTPTFTLALTGATLADSTTDFSGAEFSIKNISGDANTATITLTDGVNDYSATVNASDIEAANDGTGSYAFTFTAANGSSLTATIEASDDQTDGAGNALKFDPTKFATGHPGEDDLGQITSASKTNITPLPTYSYSLDSSTTAAKDISSFFSIDGGTSAAAVGTATLKITGSELDNNTISLNSVSLSSVSKDATNYTFTLTDDKNNTYTATIAKDEIDNQADNYSKTLTFDDGNGNTFTADFLLAGGKTINSAATTQAPTTMATIDSTEVTTPAATYTAATLSNGIVGKMGAAGDTGKSATTTSNFTIEKKANAGVTFQVGANEGDEMVINIENVNSEALGINSAKVDTQEAASAAITTVDSAINQVSSQRAYLGAIQNRLDYKIANLNTSSENLTSAESQIRDVDMAKEMTEFTNANILQQASISMLAQANSLPQNVLKLLG